VFDEAWAIQHLRLLHVNWRQRLTHAVSSLLVLTSGLLALTTLITIPLAMYAWHQKASAEASLEKAQAELNTRVRINQIESGQFAARDSKSAADDAEQLALREAAKRVLAQSTQLTLDRDAALQLVQTLEQRVTQLTADRDAARRNAQASETRVSQLGLEKARLEDRLSQYQPDIPMPKLEGLSLGAARKKLEELRLTLQVEPQSSTASSGTVVRQWPPTNTRLWRGAIVDLAVSDLNARVNSDRVDLQGLATDANGRFAKKLSPGFYEVRFEAPGFATMVYTNIAVSGSVGARLEVRLQATRGVTVTDRNGNFKSTHNGFVEGTVSDSSGKGVPNVMVTFIRS